MRLRVFVDPSRGAAGYPEIVALARESERLGFDGFFCSDHLLDTEDDAQESSSLDTWAVLAGLARDTTRIQLGSLMSTATFRLPGPLAILAATVAQLSDGRVEFGLGGGWHENEHSAYGIPFPSLKERFDRFEEQLALVCGLWATPLGQRFSFSGTHYSLVDGRTPIRAGQGSPPVIVGGLGTTRTPALAARYAQEFNVPLQTPDVTAACFQRARQACERIGRDPASLLLSCVQTAVVGATEADAAARAAAIGLRPERVAASGLYGTPDQVAQRLALLAEHGASRVYLQFRDPRDLDQLRLIAEEVMPRTVSIGG